jgi:hypothetical protein
LQKQDGLEKGKVKETGATWFACASWGIVGKERDKKKQKDKIAKKENDAVDVNDN